MKVADRPRSVVGTDFSQQLADGTVSGLVPGGTIVLRKSLAALAAVACLSTVQLQAGWPFSSNGGPPRGSDEWYAMHADDPVGERQVYKYGKLWPPQPRPTGPKQLAIHKYHTQKYWPMPYVCSDRQAVYSVWNSQAENGWQSITTMYDYHFDPQTNELNHSGQRHLQWILLNAPPERRRVSVQASTEQAINQARVSNVQMAAAAISGSAPLSEITLRNAFPAGRPAEEVQWLHEQQLELRTPPQIQYTAPDSGGGGN